MAGREIEAEAEQQLLEQREALQELQRALQDMVEASEDATELLAGYQSLQEAVAELEGLVVQLKRERLLAELADNDPRASAAAESGHTAAAPSAPLVVLGQAFRFRGSDGAFYDGVAAGAEGAHVLLRFARPTKPYQLAAARVPTAALLPAQPAPDLASQLAPGASVVVLSGGPDGASGLWEAAELVAFGEAGADVILAASGRRVRVPRANIAASRFAEGLDADSEAGDEEPSALRASSSAATIGVCGGGDDGAESSGSEGEEEEEEDEEGLGMYGRASMALAAAAAAVVSAAEAGPLSYTAHFAEYEAHTRGIGSRLLARWGYVAGRGLGARGQGMPAPLEVGRLHRGAGLGMGEPGGAVERKKRKKRGGERSRKRKFAEAAREAREAARDTQNAANLADPDAPGLFAFINSSLGDGSAAAAAHRRVLAEDRRARGGAAGQDEAGGRYFGNGAAAQAKAAPAPLGRQALAAQQDALRMLRQKVGRLKAMAVRNAKDKVMASQVARKLAETQRELQAAEAAGAAAEQAMHSSERHKKWLKF